MGSCSCSASSHRNVKGTSWLWQDSQILGQSQPLCPTRPCSWSSVSTLPVWSCKLTSHCSWRRCLLLSCFLAAKGFSAGLLLLLPPWYFSEFSFIPSRVHNLWFSLPCFLSFPGWQLAVLCHFPSTEILCFFRKLLPWNHIFPFQYSILTFEFHIPKAMFLSNSSCPPHSAAVLTMLFMHYFSCVLFIVLNQPFVTSAVLLWFVDIPGPQNYAKSAIWLVPVSPQVIPNVFSQGWQKLRQGPSCL